MGSFPNIPPEFLDEEVIRLIAKEVGQPIKLDEMTMFASRGRYARMCVQVNIDQPLLTKIQIRDEFIHVEYEGLPTICYSCGRIGHRKGVCPYTVKPHETKVQECEGEPVENASTEENMVVDGGAPVKTSINETPKYGPWIQVQGRNSRRNYGRNCSSRNE